MGSSCTSRGTNFVPITEKKASEGFSAVILKFKVEHVAAATGRSVETVKGWRAQRVFANGASLINAAKAFKPVRDWLMKEIHSGQPVEFESPRLVGGVIDALVRVAAGDSDEAKFARRLLQEMNSGARE